MFLYETKLWIDVLVILNLCINIESVEFEEYNHDLTTQVGDAHEPDIIVDDVHKLDQIETLSNIHVDIPDNGETTGYLNDQNEFEKKKMDEGSHENDEDIKNMLEKKYKFRNDETSTRYKITNDGVPVPKEDPQIAWAFRSYAVRRIVGGMETSISMYPYNVAISRNGKHWCGGCIIDEQWVLTAGHCLESAVDGDKRKLVPFIVRAGSSFHNRGGYQARVNKVFFPKSYVPGGADYDFSLLRLDRPMPIGRNIAVLNLPSKDYAMKEGDILIVTGWGSTDESGYGHIPDRIRFVPVPVMRLENCQKSYRFYITPRMLCAGYATGGKDACNHDSGGPAVRDGVLLGVVSFGGKQCGDPRSPGVYSRVSEITDWVEKTISANEAENEEELREKIQKARLRERELQKFKARVEDKKNQIKSWLRDTLKSPLFIELAKKKLSHEGFGIRKSMTTDFRRTELNNTHLLDDTAIDEVNLSNQINDQILEGGEKDESEKILRTLAVNELVRSESVNEGIGDFFSTKSSETIKLQDPESDLDATIETLIAYITEK
ncbi:hypothetical protein O0L34_g10182 [Tuta absoluta]|nr:hypothetical protein O0L34_g10182 [Tuta absoluta]